MSPGEDQDMAPNIGDIDTQVQLAALTHRVAALEAQLAQLTHPQAPAPAILKPLPPPILPLAIVSPAPLPALPQTPPFAATPPPVRPSLEDRLGSQIFNFIGMAAIIIGASWALKLAIEHGLIDPAARIILGLAIGAGLILWSQRFRRKGFAAFSYSLKAVGSGILYLSLWAAFQIYHLLPAPVALVAMVLVTAWNAFMAWSQDAELLAAYALAGGLATPLLLSTGGNHETFLFLYLAAIDTAAVLLLRWKPWHRLLVPAYLATAVYFIGWYGEFFHRGVPRPPLFYANFIHVWDVESTETTLFVLLFAVIFALPSLRRWITSTPPDLGSEAPQSVPHSSRVPSSMSGSTIQGIQSVILDVLIPLGNAAFLSLALYSVLQDSGLHSFLAWTMLALSALYLGLMRLQATSTARAIHLAIAVIFLTVAIPFKASGHTLTTAWLVEGLVLYWASNRVETTGESDAPAKVLYLLSAAGYLLGLLSLAIQWAWFNNPSADTFLNHNLASALVAIASLATAAWLSSRLRPISIAPLTLSITAIDLVAFLLLLGELSSFTSSRLHPAFRTPDFLNALVALAVLAVASWSEYRLARSASADPQPFWTLAASSLVAFNLFTILTAVREISALWENTTVSAEANVQRSLAISAFLMLYGAVLLAAGFWRRSAFVRWQALILLIFTILKVFLSDVSGLSQGYRVASFLGLGALLMAVSFAYQKDWLGLKTAPLAAPAPAPPTPAPAPPAQEQA